MSALERLTAYLCSDPGFEHMDEEYAAFAARLLRQHAHELAEKIISDPKATEVAYRPGLMWAAEVIDPQADREDA